MNQAESSFLSHIEELRKRLIISLLAIALLSAVSFFLSDFFLQIICIPVQKSVPELYFLSPYEAFMTKLKVSLAAGALLSLPVVFTQLWLFVSPGLYKREQKMVLPIASASVFLFVLGACFAYFLVMPFALKFFLGFQSDTLRPLISIGSYLSFFLSVILIFGITFDLPVVLIGLIYFKVVGTQLLSRRRKLVVVLIFLSAAILTPTVDIITQCLLALPLWLLFECSLLAGGWIEKKRDTSQSPLYT